METTTPTLRDRVLAMVEAVIQTSAFDGPFRPVILNLVKNNLLAKVSEEELAAGLRKMRDEIIPWLLGEKDAPDENSHPE